MASHSTHHLLAIYSMGAGPKLLKAAYATHVAYQRPAIPSPGPVTKDNWKDFLGDERWSLDPMALISMRANLTAPDTTNLICDSSPIFFSLRDPQASSKTISCPRTPTLCRPKGKTNRLRHSVDS